MPGVAGDDEDAAASGLHRLERLASGRELARAPDEPRLDSGEPPLASRLGRDTRDDPRRNPLALAFQLEIALPAPVEDPLDRAMRRLVHEDGSGIGRRLEPRRDVDRVTERGVLDSRSGADLAQHDRPGRDPDPHAEAFGSPAAPYLAPVLVHLSDHAQRAAHRALGVVLARRRCAEEREHAVAGEILHVPAERLDLADDAGDCLADDVLHVLRIDALRERGRADDVRKDGRHNLPFLAHVRHADLQETGAGKPL